MGGTQRVFSGAPWEGKVGYCRAIRRGRHIWVTGTVALDADGQPVAPGDPYVQAQRCLAIIAEALDELGANLADVVRTRMYVTDIAHWQEFGRAHGEVFRASPPATTMVEIANLIGPDFLIEIEADAYVDS